MPLPSLWRTYQPASLWPGDIDLSGVRSSGGRVPSLDFTPHSNPDLASPTRNASLSRLHSAVLRSLRACRQVRELQQHVVRDGELSERRQVAQTTARKGLDLRAIAFSAARDAGESGQSVPTTHGMHALARATPFYGTRMLPRLDEYGARAVGLHLRMTLSRHHQIAT